MKFSHAVAKVFADSGGKVLFIALQKHGKLMLNYEGQIESGQVIFALAHGYNDVGKVVTVDQVKRMHQSISFFFWCLGFLQLQGARMSTIVHIFFDV